VDSVLFFYDFAEAQQVLEALTCQIQGCEKVLQEIQHHKAEVLQQLPDTLQVFTTSIFNHHEFHHRAELQWLQETVSELQQYIQEGAQNTEQ
jgi:hypothetical protein